MVDAHARLADHDLKVRVIDSGLYWKMMMFGTGISIAESFLENTVCEFLCG